MKQKTLIILGILAVLLLLAAWVYLLFFGTPKDPKQVFTDLGFAGEEDAGIVIEPEIVVEEPVVNMKRSRLRQLTTKPVVGFTEVQATSSAPASIYYAEAGTGHVFQINLDSGSEIRLSNTTVQGANFASFSPSGKWVAIGTENDRRLDSIKLGSLNSDTDSLDLVDIKGQIDNFKIINDEELVYTKKTSAGLVNHFYNLVTKKDVSLFTVPFFEAKMLWGTSSKSLHHTYPKPSYLLEGYLYRINSKGDMSRLPAEGFGLTGFSSGNFVVYNSLNGESIKSYLKNLSTGELKSLPILLLPEKCSSNNLIPEMVWCGHDFDAVLPIEFPDTWYRGAFSFKDELWEINLETLEINSLVDTFTESKREVDVINLTVSPQKNALYFINKNDNTLWMYEL